MNNIQGAHVICIIAAACGPDLKMPRKLRGFFFRFVLILSSLKDCIKKFPKACFFPLTRPPATLSLNGEGKYPSLLHEG